MVDIKKTCNRCLLTKLVSEFNSDASKPDGNQNHCKECDKTARAKRQNKDAPSYKKNLVDSLMRDINPNDY